MGEMWISNQAPWRDTDGNVIRAHGGGFLFENGHYYWFGENRVGGRKVSCYRSPDLMTWEFRGDVLTVESKAKPVYYRTSLEMNPFETVNGANIERPKVLFNEKTGKYVMWMHWENGKDYIDARCAVATCDTIDGEYIYHGSFNPIGHMSRDCTLFQDDDGSAYFISAARDNADLHMYRLSDDYLSIDEHVKTLWSGQYREAPAVVKRSGVYFLISSACTGWLPNQGTYAFADSLSGRWSPLYPFGNVTTYDTQPTFILPVRGSEVVTYLYVGDRWDPSDYHNSSYVFLPIEFPSDREMNLGWVDTLKLDVRTGRLDTTVEAREDRFVRIRSKRTQKYMAASNKNAAGETLSYRSEQQKWVLEESAKGYIRLKNACLNRYLTAGPAEQSGKVPVALTEYGEAECLDWSLKAVENDQFMLIHKSTGKALTVNEKDPSELILTADEQGFDQNQRQDRQLFLLAKVY